MDYALKKSDLQSFLTSLSKRFQVIAPVKNDSGIATFQEFQGQEPYLGLEKLSSPKKFFRPPKEKIFSFSKKKTSYEIKPVFDKTKRIIFGIRPCDSHALQALDELFIRYYGLDQFYSSRRKNTLLISLQCTKACENGFCQSMGTSLPAGAELTFIERGDEFFVRPETEQGRALLNSKLFKQTSDAEPASKISCKTSLETHNLTENIYRNFKSPVWKQEAERCLSCTSCTQVCPTCYCYLTDDEFEFGSGSLCSRFRFLDSCQLKRFTTVAGNHSFRESRTSRLRQFVLHKLSYYFENHGMQLCIGCGRCISVCPTKISLVEIANRIQKKALEGKG
jgi:ferredoxin